MENMTAFQEKFRGRLDSANDLATAHPTAQICGLPHVIGLVKGEKGDHASDLPIEAGRLLRGWRR